MVDRLREGKRLLRESRESGTDDAAERALGVFLAVLDDVRNDKATQESLDSAWKAERKAYRGLGGASEGLGMHREALEHMQRVVAVSKEHGDDTGLGDAYGVIADISTEMGDFAQAAEYYDLYIADLGNSVSL